jgi:Holliday junction DNA helicase RuvA
LIQPSEHQEVPLIDDFSKQVLDVMIKQLGHKPADAKKMIAKAMNRNDSITTAEALFDEVYLGEKMEGAGN